MSFEPQIQYCTSSKGVNIAYYTIGEGPLLLVLPGLPTQLQIEAQSQLGELYEQWARTHQVVRFDFGGTGLSQHAGIVPTSESCAGDIETVVDHMGGERCSLYATGFSCTGAIVYAARHQDRVERLVLWEGYTGRTDLGSQMDTLSALLQHDYDMFIETLARTIIGWDAPESAAPYALMLRSAMSKDEWLRFFLQADDSVEDELERITCPTLVVHNRDAALIPMEAIQRLVAKIPNARLTLLDGSSVGKSGEISRMMVEEFLRPDGSISQQPRATVREKHVGDGATAIILFTDVVDSTGLTERMGDARFRELSRALDASLRNAIRDAGGVAVEGKLLGDGVLATFGSAAQAIDGARRCLALSAASELGLHIGLHAGDVIREEVDGRRDVFGGAVNIAARICGLSAPGEILVSDVVRGMARSSAGVVFEDRGEQEMKGVGEAVRVYAVRGGG